MPFFMPTFAGATIFGESVTINTEANPRDTQTNAFFGLNGIEELDGGFRGLVTRASGRLVAPSAQALAQQEALMRGFADGNAYYLSDSSGTVWGNVKLHTFKTDGRVKQEPNGTCWRSYEAIFRHLP